MAALYNADGTYAGEDNNPPGVASSGGLDSNKPVKAETQKSKGKIVEVKPPKNVYTTSSGEPTIPLEGMGDIKNSRITVSNNNKVHVCDTTLYIRRQINLGKIAKTVIDGIRKAIKALLEFLGINPGSNAIVEKLKKVSRYIKDQIKLLKEINAAIDTFIIVVREIKAVIEYILSLPEKYIAYFLGCLKEAYAELAKQFADVVKAGSDALSDSTGDIINATTDVLKDTASLITTATATVAKASTALPTALVTTNSAAETAKAQEILGGSGKAEVDKFVSDSFSAYTPTTNYSKGA